jgi:predicted nucleic acid-binding protein
MNVLFTDTAGWMACADASDPFHEEALQARNDWLSHGGVLGSTDYVTDETLTLLRMRLGLTAARTWWESVSASQRVRWISINGDDLETARTLFFKQRDKAYSFTDCTSFVIMKAGRMKTALTTDHHFAQAGFQCLPYKTLKS